MSDAPEGLAQLGAPPIFVVGMHRSGTTWVYEMLASHPHVAGVFESGMFSHDLGIAPLFSPAHWYEGEVRRRDEELFGARFRLGGLLERDDVVTDMRRLTGAWLARAVGPEDRYLVEKTPQHAFAMPLIAELFPGAAFVHVLRDGRDVAVSVEHAAGSWPRGRVRAARMRDVAGRWVSVIEAARRAAGDHGLRYREVRFEDLKARPQEGLRDLLDFCGIAADHELVDRMVSQTALDSRRRSEGDVFRRRGAVGDWRSHFGPLDRARFHRAAGTLLVELGYASGRRWWLRGR